MQAAGTTLIAVRLIHGATVFQFALSFASVDTCAVYASFKETRTPCENDKCDNVLLYNWLTVFGA